MKRKIIIASFLTVMLCASGFLTYKIYAQYQKKLMIVAEIAKIESIDRKAIMAPPPPVGSSPPPPAPTIIHMSPTDGLRVELQEETSWNTILQLIFTLLSTYLGVKLINRYVKE